MAVLKTLRDASAHSANYRRIGSRTVFDGAQRARKMSGKITLIRIGGEMVEVTNPEPARSIA